MGHCLDRPARSNQAWGSLRQGEASEHESKRQECQELQAARIGATAVGRRRRPYPGKCARNPWPQLCRRGWIQTNYDAPDPGSTSASPSHVRAMTLSARLNQCYQTPALPPEICRVAGEAGRTSALGILYSYFPRDSPWPILVSKSTLHLLFY